MQGARSQSLFSHWLFAPLLAATYPVFALYAENVDEAFASDLIRCWITVAAVAVALALALRMLFASKLRGSIAAALIVVWFFAFSSFLYVGRKLFAIVNVPNFAMLMIVSTLWSLAVVALFVVLRKSPRDEATLARLHGSVTWICAVLVGLACLQGAIGYSKLQAKLANTQPPGLNTADYGAELPTNIHELSESLPEIGRDVYFLVFDRYGNAAALNNYFELDNSAFYTELEGRGFRVYRDARSSYPMTLLSMSSTLNMEYHGEQLRAFSDYAAELKEHVVGRWFIDAGYQFFHVGCSFGPLQTNNLAHRNVSTAFLSSEFSHALLRRTPIGRALGYTLRHQEVVGQFRALADIAQDERPTFTYVHFNSPHPPYIFKRDGSTRSVRERFPVGAQDAYAAQLVAINSMMLDAVDEILRASSDTPIIILQSDEGPYLGPGDETLPRIEKIAKRTGMLSAILVPDADIASRLPAELAPVNTFRFLFREYLELPIELLPMRVFWWDDDPFGHSTAEMDVTEEIKNFDNRSQSHQVATPYEHTEAQQTN